MKKTLGILLTAAALIGSTAGAADASSNDSANEIIRWAKAEVVITKTTVKRTGADYDVKHEVVCEKLMKVPVYRQSGTLIPKEGFTECKTTLLNSDVTAMVTVIIAGTVVKGDNNEATAAKSILVGLSVLGAGADIPREVQPGLLANLTTSDLSLRDMRFSLFKVPFEFCSDRNQETYGCQKLADEDFRAEVRITDEQ